MGQRQTSFVRAGALAWYQPMQTGPHRPPQTPTRRAHGLGRHSSPSHCHHPHSCASVGARNTLFLCPTSHKVIVQKVTELQNRVGKAPAFPTEAVRTPPGRGVCKRPKQGAHAAGGGPATATPLPPMSSRAGGSVGNHLPMTSRNPDDSEGLEGPLEAEASRNQGSVTVTCRNQDSRSVLPRGRPGCGPLLWATGSCRASAGSSP